jgi:hypothetical protein
LKGGYKYEFKYVPQTTELTGAEQVGKKATLPTGTLEKVGLASFMTVVLIGGLVASAVAAGVLHAANGYFPLVVMGTTIIGK